MKYTHNKILLLVLGAVLCFGTIFSYRPALSQTAALVKIPDNPTVYVVDVNGTKRPFVNENVMRSYGFTAKQITTISPAELENIPLSRVIKAESDPTVYRLNPNLTIQGITSWEVFIALGFTPLDIVPINKVELGFYGQGPVLDSPPLGILEFEEAINEQDSGQMAALMESPVLIGPLGSEFITETATAAAQTLLTQMEEVEMFDFMPDLQLVGELERYWFELQDYIVGLSEPINELGDRAMVAYRVGPNGLVDRIAHSRSICFATQSIPCGQEGNI